MIKTLPPGGRAYIESHFIDFTRAAFSQVESMNWNPDREASDLYIGSENSLEDLETVPRIMISIGDLSETGQSIGNLSAITPTSSEFIFVDQGVANIACYSEIERESSDMAYYLRRMLMNAREDFRKLGLFGIRNPQVTKANPNSPGTFKDNLFGSILVAPFMVPNKEVINQNERNPLFSGESSIIIQEPGVTVNNQYPASWGRLPSVPAFIKATGKEVEGEVQIHLIANHPVDPYLPTGLRLMRGEVEIESAITKDPHNAFAYVIEAPTPFLFKLRLVYTPGNIRSFATGVSFEASSISVL